MTKKILMVLVLIIALHGVPIPQYIMAGVVTLKKDFGYGYSYEILLENAKLIINEEKH